MGTMVEDWLAAQNKQENPIMLSGKGEKIFEDIFQHPVESIEEENGEDVFVEVCQGKQNCKEKHSYISPDIRKLLNEIIPGSPEYKYIPLGAVYDTVSRTMIKIWRKAIGPIYPDHFGERVDVPAFDKAHWRRVLSRARTRYIEVFFEKQVEKLCAEAQCMKGNGDCNNPCPTPSTHICPNLKDYER